VGFNVIDQLLIRFSAFNRHWRKKYEYNETVHQLFTEFGVPMKLVRLIMMCLNETYSKLRIGKHLSESFPVQNGLKQGDVFKLCFRICH
jgi:hypothetical protein